jgi:hypothetical protein
LRPKYSKRERNNMGNRKIVIGAVILVVFVGLVMFVVSKASVKKMPAQAVRVNKSMKKTPAQKIISKGKGALTVKIVNSKNMEIPMKIKAFKVIDGRSSVYAASFVGGRMQELTPGTYDIEVDSVPQKIFKNIKVNGTKETVEDLGCVTGSIVVRTLNAKKVPAYYPMRVLYSNGNDMVTAYMTNKSMEIVPGVYDIEIGTSPRIYKKDVKVDAGKEVTIDMGCVVGSLMVKTVDANGKNVRSGVRITKADTNEVVSSTISNRPIDLGKGTYNLDILSSPKQSKKDVKIAAGEESTVEFVIAAPATAAAVPQKPAKSAAKAKKK